MQDKKHLKVQGIRFARSLQTLMKMVNMFSAEHKSASGLLQRTYELLNPLLKQSKSLTIGFIDQRMLLNNILTAEESLKPLENEFLKRGIGAVTFDAGITLTAFRTAVGAIATNPKLIQESGGLLPFLEQKQLEFVRVFPAARSEQRNEEGDTVLEMGSEEYLISKALGSMNSGFTHGIEAMLSHMEAGAGSGEGGSGAGFGGSGNGTGFGGGSGNGTAFGGGYASGMSSGGLGSSVAFGGPAVVAGAGVGPGIGSGSGSAGSPAGSAYLTEMQRVVEQKFEASLKNPDEDPQKAYLELAKMLRTVRPDVVLNNIAADSGNGGGSSTPQELTAEVFEDTALRWAMKRLAVVPAGDDAVIVEEQVFRVLMRSLQATHSATRLAKKLAEFAKEYALPPRTMERIQAEVRWLTLTPHQKLCELLAVTHFSTAEFRRCLELIKEFIRQGEPEQAMALGVQYFSIFEDPLTLEAHEVARIPELLRGLAGTQGEFWVAATEYLTAALLNRKVNELLHFQLVNALATLARIAATYERFDLVQQVGLALEQLTSAEPDAHARCCAAVLAALLPPSAVDRITEMFFDRKTDGAWIRLVTGVLRWAGPEALERIFIALDNELITTNRLALIRFLARLGPAALAPARKRLRSSDWYVVRNACKILGELKDPELLEQISHAFGSKDERVQKAALQAIVENRLPGSAKALALLVPKILPALVEDVLYELISQADPECLSALEVCFCSPVPAAVLSRLVSAVSAIQTAGAADLLLRISRDSTQQPHVRLAAKHALENRPVKPQKREPETASDLLIKVICYAGA